MASGLENIETIESPFRRFVTTIGVFPTAFTDAMTYYECLAYLVKYLEETVIPAVNDNAEALAELQNLFVELKSYVDNYFANLDVQEEINNKLDEMAESGVLANIISEYVFKDLDISDNYIIQSTDHTSVDYNIKYHKTVISPKVGKTTYVPLKGKFCTDDIDTAYLEVNQKNMFDFSKDMNALFISNADSAGSIDSAVYIRDGNVLRSTGSGAVCGIDNEGNLKVYTNVTSSDTLVADNIQNSWGCQILIKDNAIDRSTWDSATAEVYNVKHPRTLMLQDTGSKSIVFLHIEGRRADSVGLTFEECCEFVLDLYPNVKNVIAFGGGGDTQLMVKGRIKNDCNDNQLRPLYDIIYLDGNLEEPTNEGSKEIVDARNTNTTIHEYLKDKVLTTDNLYYANRLMVARFAAYDGGYVRFVCDVDYNTTLEVNDIVFIKFPDMDEVLTSEQKSGVVTLNIHYAEKTFQPDLLHEDGSVVQPLEINDKITICKWNGEHYILMNTNSGTQIISGGSEPTFDLNNFKKAGFYYSTTFKNTPSDIVNPSEAGFVQVIEIPIEGRVTQIYYTNSNKVYIRNYVTGWSNWIKIDSSERVAMNGINLNNVVDKYYKFYGNNLTNKPASAGNGWCINIPGALDGYNVQFFIERQTGASTGGKIFARMEDNSVWYDWKQITTS